jgi:integrase/recombinase XerD
MGMRASEAFYCGLDLILECRPRATEATILVMSDAQVTPTALAKLPGRLLTAEVFQNLADVPPTDTWLARIGNRNTRRAYHNDLREFVGFLSIWAPVEFRLVTRAHVQAWCSDLERRRLAGSSIRRKLAAVSSLFEYLSHANSVTHNPAKGVRRPRASSYARTRVLQVAQARQLLKLPAGDDLKSLRDRALLSVLLHHGLRREELSALKVYDMHLYGGALHLRVRGKHGKARKIPLHPHSQKSLTEYLEASGRALDKTMALFRTIRDNRTGKLGQAVSPDGIYKLVRGYAKKLGMRVGAHSLRATAASNALEHGADIAMVQEWLGHANIATTRLYDPRRNRSKDSPTFKVSY